jgi:hypothetical protein
VNPKRAVMGRRACFQVTVTDAAGKPVAESTVTLGRKTKTTDATGQARICRRFKKTGRPPLSAQKTGFEGASQTVRVRRPK